MTANWATVIYDPAYDLWVIIGGPAATNYPITGFGVSAGSAAFAFDDTFPNPGTDGSGPGMLATLSNFGGFTDPTTTAWESEPVALAGSAPVGDLYQTVFFTFYAQPLTMGVKVGIYADIDPESLASGIPEPPTVVVLLCGFALLVLSLARREREWRR